MSDPELLQIPIKIIKWTDLLANFSLSIGAFCIGYLCGKK